MPPMRMVHDIDPAKVIFDNIGSLTDFELFGNQVLLGMYMRPEKTKTGIILADSTRKEDEYQGKAGLVIKLGPSAFVSDGNYDFKGQSVEVGDWCICWVQDGRKVYVNGQLCRIVKDVDIVMKIPSPDSVF